MNILPFLLIFYLSIKDSNRISIHNISIWGSWFKNILKSISDRIWEQWCNHMLLEYKTPRRLNLQYALYEGGEPLTPWVSAKQNRASLTIRQPYSTHLSLVPDTLIISKCKRRTERCSAEAKKVKCNAANRLCDVFRGSDALQVRLPFLFLLESCFRCSFKTVLFTYVRALQ